MKLYTIIIKSVDWPPGACEILALSLKRCIFLISNALFQFVTHLEDDTIGGLEASVTRMLEADPDFRKYYHEFSKFRQPLYN